MGGWEVNTLGALAKVNYGYTAKASFEINGPKFLRITDIQDGNVNWDKVPSCEIADAGYNKHKLMAGDIVFARTGATTGKSFLITECENSVAASYLIRVRLTDERILPDYLYLFFQSAAYWDTVNAGTSGSAQGGFNASKLSSLLIPTPPIPEQKRIATILDQAFADIDKARANAEQNLKNARELFESYLQQVFSQRGEGAEMVALAEITESISDGDHSAPPKSAEGIPFITISNIDKSTNEIDFSNTFKVPEGYYSQLKTTRKPKLGDVLYTVTGSYGIPVVVREEKEFCFQRHIGLIRPNKDIDSHWLYYLLMSPQVFKQADEGATGTAQKTVSLKLLRSLIVPKVPLDIQVDMREDLDFMYTKTKKLESIYQVKLNSLDELKKSILQKAFSGELTKNENKGAAA